MAEEQIVTTGVVPPETDSDRPDVGLDPTEVLLLQQLQQTKFWSDRAAGAARESDGKGSSPAGAVEVVPTEWRLTGGLELHDWQRACVQSWWDAGRRGVIKVVTGAGKTVLALAIAERLQQTDRPTLRVAVVVPTVVLLNQWREEFTERGNLPTSAIGLMGGGNADGFNGKVRVLICVLHSAAKKLPTEVSRSGVAEDLLLIVDECHRAGSAEMRQVFETGRAFSLGLSATPERTDDPVDDDGGEEGGDEVEFSDTVLGQELGPVVYEMNYAEAIARGVLPPFRIVHYGLSLSPREKEKYERTSREITNLRKELETGTRRGLALIKWCRTKAGSQNPRAAQLLALTGERKRLLFRMRERFEAVDAILRRAFSDNPESKAILFHESIDEVMHLFARLRQAGYAVVAEHSQFPDALRAESLRLFRNGAARVIVSARSLIEGFNVPSADLGIVVAASASVRQRVQTLGRLLRRNRSGGAEKQAALYVLYAAGTVDELIYEKADWEQFVGADRNDYFLWKDVAKDEPQPRSEPPRRPPVDEGNVDPNMLVNGGTYPGNSDQGQLYSLDTQGTVRDEQINLIEPNERLQTLLAGLRASGGRFRVTPRQRYVIRLEKAKEGWKAVYLGQLDQPLRQPEARSLADSAMNAFSRGSPYPLSSARGQTFSVLQRDKRLIARKAKGQVRFVVPAEQLAAPEKQAKLRQVQQQLAEVYQRGHRISKITVTGEGHVVYVYDGQAFFVGYAPEGTEGFIFDERESGTP